MAEWYSGAGPAGYGRARSPMLDKLEARVPVGLGCALLLKCPGLAPEGLIHPKGDPAQSNYNHTWAIWTPTLDALGL